MEGAYMLNGMPGLFNRLRSMSHLSQLLFLIDFIV